VFATKHEDEASSYGFTPFSNEGNCFVSKTVDVDDKAANANCERARTRSSPVSREHDWRASERSTFPGDKRRRARAAARTIESSKSLLAPPRSARPFHFSCALASAA